MFCGPEEEKQCFYWCISQFSQIECIFMRDKQKEPTYSPYLSFLMCPPPMMTLPLSERMCLFLSYCWIHWFTPYLVIEYLRTFKMFLGFYQKARQTAPYHYRIFLASSVLVSPSSYFLFPFNIDIFESVITSQKFSANYRKFLCHLWWNIITFFSYVTVPYSAELPDYLFISIISSHLGIHDLHQDANNFERLPGGRNCILIGHS